MNKTARDNIAATKALLANRKALVKLPRFGLPPYVASFHVRTSDSGTCGTL